MFTAQEVQGQKATTLPRPLTGWWAGNLASPPHTRTRAPQLSSPGSGALLLCFSNGQMQTPSSLANSHASFEKPQFPYLLSSLKISYN